MLDYEYINVLADILLDETCSEKERKFRFELVKKIQGRAQYYLERGFLPQVVEAFFAEKMEGISKVFTQKDAELFLKPSTPQVQYGDITTPNRPFYSEAEELMLWSETSYRGPLVPAGNKRYQELFQKIMPKEAAFL